MIVRMSNVEIAGPKQLLQSTVALLRDLGVFQVEPLVREFAAREQTGTLRSFALDEQTAMERAIVDDLRRKIDDLLPLLPDVSVRESYLEPEKIFEPVTRVIERHLRSARDLTERRESLRRERDELERHSLFLASLAGLMQGARETPDLDFIGLTIREPGQTPRLREALSRITDWKYDLQTADTDDGSLIGLITVEKSAAHRVRSALAAERVPEFAFPASLSGLSFAEKVAYVDQRVRAIGRELDGIAAELRKFTRRWLPLYRSLRAWADDRLALLKTTASAYESRMCFFIDGWMPSRDVAFLRNRLKTLAAGKVVVTERRIREEDLDRVPIILSNPAYFRPFELLTGLLPLPAYTSYDPTPFMGIFFPVFFGIILGDAGYGLALAGVAVVLIKKYRSRRALRDAGMILLSSAAYAVLFGVLFGEFFGDLPERLFHLQPLWLERRTAIAPMLFFALAIGVAHVTLGLLLGAVNDFRRRIRREGAHKLLNVAVIACLSAVLASFFGYFPEVLTRPLMLTILALAPLLLFAGGVLAPLELLKSIGNIISYVRIAAIGLTSVLLAFTANELGGLTGDVVAGIVVAGLLHLLNIVLGLFSPAIHSLRLHYVEFFGKFIEPGGRKFEPLKR